MKIPVSFIHPLFYNHRDELELSKFAWHWQDCLTSPFKYDIAYALGVAPVRLPWEHNDVTVPMLLLAWKEAEGDISSLHEQRYQNEIRTQMVFSIALFLQSIAWINGEPVRSLSEWQEEMKRFKHKPINVEERLDFVIKKPSMYHSFIQLQQLFSECHKLYYKLKAIEKK